MLRSLASRAVALRLVNTARTASTSHITTTRQPLSQLIATRSFATATPTVPVTAPTQRTIPGVPIPPEFVLTPEERNQHDWEQWDQAKMNIYVLSVFFGGILLVNYWYHREYEHFKHHRHQQEPYAFFIKRDDVVAAGFWPGRACQFLEFNCFAATYDAAEKMLEEKKKQGGPQDNKQEKEHH